MATTKLKKVEPTEKKTKTTTTEESAVTADDIVKSLLNNITVDNSKSNDKKFILCHSVIQGGLNINCKSGNVYEFDSFGSDCEIEYHDLVALVRKHSEHIFMPRIVIDDEDFLAEFPQICKAYDNIYTSNELDELFDLPVEQMMSEIKSMPKSVSDGLRSLISTKIANGSIDSVRKIRALSEYYDSDFNLLSELFAR